MDRGEAERSETWKARRKAYQRRVESIRKRIALKQIVRPMTREEELRAIEAFVATGRVVRVPSAYVGDDTISLPAGLPGAPQRAMARCLPTGSRERVASGGGAAATPF